MFGRVNDFGDGSSGVQALFANSGASYESMDEQHNAHKEWIEDQKKKKKNNEEEEKEEENQYGDPSKEGIMFSSYMEAFLYAEGMANLVEVEVAFFVEVDIEGNVIYFVQPWIDNLPNYSNNETLEKDGDRFDAYNPENRIIEQHHFAPYIPNEPHRGGSQEDAMLSTNRGIPTYHHGYGRIYEFLPTIPLLPGLLFYPLYPKNN